METTEYSLPALISKAEHYCATAEHCFADVTLKLRHWGCHTEDTDTILSHLQEHGYVDEVRYAKALVHDKVAYDGWGRNKIKAALYAKHIPENIVSTALQTIDQDAYLHALQRALKQKKGATREQLLRFVLQRGFTYDEVVDQL